MGEVARFIVLLFPTVLVIHITHDKKCVGQHFVRISHKLIWPLCLSEDMALAVFLLRKSEAEQLKCHTYVNVLEPTLDMLHLQLPTIIRLS
jgi:hypothetical protein